MVDTGEIQYPGRTKPSHYCLVVYEVGPSKARGIKPDYKSPGPPGWGLNVGLTTLLRKTCKCYGTHKREAKALHGL
jgi:hypothetical protein